MEYMQCVFFAEDFQQQQTYSMSVLMAPKSYFLYTHLIVSSVLNLTSEFKKFLDMNPSFPVLSISVLKNNILKGAGAAYREQVRMIRLKIEV
jgi:hypothetical protein